MEPLIAVYDACVLYPAFLRDFLVRLAILGRQRELLRAKWTGRIHREWIAALLRQRPDLSRDRLSRTRQLMDQSVRGCRVRSYQRWERRLRLPDPDDRHVLAAALACVADCIVTFNTTDFPSEALAPFGVKSAMPDDFVKQFLQNDLVHAAAVNHRASLHQPPLSVEAYLEALRLNRLPETAAFLSTVQI